MIKSKKPPQKKLVGGRVPKVKRAHVEDTVIAAAVTHYFTSGSSSQTKTALTFGMRQRSLANYIAEVKAVLVKRGVDVTKPIHIGLGVRATIPSDEVLRIVQERKQRQRGSLPLMNVENREKFFDHVRLRSQCNFGMTVREMQIVVQIPFQSPQILSCIGKAQDSKRKSTCEPM